MLSRLRILAVVLFAGFLSLGASSASADLVFFDDFEGGTIGDIPLDPVIGQQWVFGGTDEEKQTIHANPLSDAYNSSSQVLETIRNDALAGRSFADLTPGDSARLAAGELLTIRFQHYQPEDFEDSIALGIYDNLNHDYSGNSVDVEFHIDREVVHYKDAIAGFESTGLYGSENWDDVEVIVDFAADTWSVSLNGGAPVSGLPFRNDGDYTTAASMVISPSSGHVLGYIDNFKVYIGDTSEPGSDSADFNSDSSVDGMDFLTWQQGFGINDGSAQLVDGDATGDGNIDGADLTVWQDQYGPTASLAAVSAVPEPATGILLVVATALLGASSRRRSS